eukprot:110427-Pyramimonas_sp.AAC.1
MRTSRGFQKNRRDPETAPADVSSGAWHRRSGAVARLHGAAPTARHVEVNVNNNVSMYKSDSHNLLRLVLYYYHNNYFLVLVLVLVRLTSFSTSTTTKRTLTTTTNNNYYAYDYYDDYNDHYDYYDYNYNY